MSEIGTPKWLNDEIHGECNAIIKGRNADIERLRDDREAAVKRVLDAGLSTGHADSCEDLLAEVLEQFAEKDKRIEELEAALSIIGVVECDMCSGTGEVRTSSIIEGSGYEGDMHGCGFPEYTKCICAKKGRKGWRFRDD